jgi:DNA repair exonuclease SbcCD ATPase subunit
MRIRKLTIKGFRGFNEEQNILLDSNVVLIYGLNGSGKSSFVEALEWLFFGEISRQRLSRCKSEYQYEEYLRNLFYSSSDTPFVEVEGSIKGRPVIIKKEISSDGEKLSIDGKEVQNLESLNLNLENYFRPMLAQTEIKALVDSEQKDRWEQLSSILGQDDLTRLRENLISLRNNKKRDENYRKLEQKWNAILSDLSEISTLSSLINPIKQLDLPETIIGIQKIVGSKDQTLNGLLRDTRNKLKSLLNTELGKRVSDISFKERNEFANYLTEIFEQFLGLEEQASKSVLGGHDHNYLDFLKVGVSLAKPPECPFCLERTLARKRLDDINNALEQGKDAQEAKSQFQQNKIDIDQWIRSFSDQIKKYLPSQQELKIIAQKFLDIGEEELASLIQNLVRKVDESILKSSRDIKAACDSQLSYIERKYFHGQRDIERVEAIEKAVTDIGSQSEAIINEWENLKGKIAEKVPLSGQANPEEIKAWLSLEKIIKFFSEAKLFIVQTRLLERVDTIQEKLERYEKKEVTRLLCEHGAEIKKYYDKLNPGDKIQFSDIEVKGGARRQARLKAEAFGREVNPITIFSEAHTNSLALSIYFPQRVDRNNTWESVILDDPVQSMDENHSRALIDILVDISDKKQVIVLTHSKSFFKRLCARFYHRKPKIYSFYYNEDKGPSVKLSAGETLDFLTLIEENCKKGDVRSLETASNQLRKAIESVCIEFLLDKGTSFGKTQKIQGSGFASLFTEVEENGLPISEVGKLKSLLDTSSSDSHAWSVSDSTPGGLRTGIRYIKDIYDNYLK